MAVLGLCGDKNDLRSGQTREAECLQFGGSLWAPPTCPMCGTSPWGTHLRATSIWGLDAASETGRDSNTGTWTELFSEQKPSGSPYNSLKWFSTRAAGPSPSLGPSQAGHTQPWALGSLGPKSGVPGWPLWQRQFQEGCPLASLVMEQSTPLPLETRPTQGENTGQFLNQLCCDSSQKNGLGRSGQAATQGGKLPGERGAMGWCWGQNQYSPAANKVMVRWWCGEYVCSGGGCEEDRVMALGFPREGAPLWGPSTLSQKPAWHQERVLGLSSKCPEQLFPPLLLGGSLRRGFPAKTRVPG